MYKSPACDYPTQPSTLQIDHPKYREWFSYRAACAAQLVTAATFESWLGMEAYHELAKAGMLPYQIVNRHPRGQEYWAYSRKTFRQGLTPISFDEWLELEKA